MPRPARLLAVHARQPSPADPQEAVAPAATGSVLHAMPGHLVRRLQQVHAALFAQECAAHGLTSVQFAALIAIGENPGIDATRLSGIIAFDRSTIGDVLERLELRGWIARAPRRADRRVKSLHLSPAGRAVLHAVRPAVARVQERLLLPLEGEDRSRFLALLTELVDLHHEGPETQAEDGTGRPRTRAARVETAPAEGAIAGKGRATSA